MVRAEVFALQHLVKKAVKVLAQRERERQREGERQRERERERDRERERERENLHKLRVAPLSVLVEIYLVHQSRGGVRGQRERGAHLLELLPVDRPAALLVGALEGVPQRRHLQEDFANQSDWNSHCLRSALHGSWPCGTPADRHPVCRTSARTPRR